MTQIPYDKSKSVLWNAANRYIIYINRIEIMPESTSRYSLDVHQYLDPEQAKDELIGLYETFITGHLLYKVDLIMLKVHQILLAVVKMMRHKPYADLHRSITIALQGILTIEA